MMNHRHHHYYQGHDNNNDDSRHNEVKERRSSTRKGKKKNKKDRPINDLNCYIHKNLPVNLVAIEEIGQGGYGTVYRGELNGSPVAIKAEKARSSHALEDEYKIYQQLQLCRPFTAAAATAAAFVGAMSSLSSSMMHSSSASRNSSGESDVTAMSTESLSNKSDKSDDTGMSSVRIRRDSSSEDGKSYIMTPYSASSRSSTTSTASSASTGDKTEEMKIEYSSTTHSLTSSAQEEIDSATSLAKCLYYHSGDKEGRGGKDRRGSEFSYRILVLPLLGDNLETIKNEHKSRRLDLVTVYKIAIQLLRQIKYIHKQGIIHKDVKPENIVLLPPAAHGDRDKQSDDMDLKDDDEDDDEKDASGIRVSLIDYGMSKRYLRRNGHHIDETDKDIVEGTARFMGEHAHMGKNASRRDDIQSLVYTLIYLRTGRLPWQGLNKDNKYSETEKRRRVFLLKSDKAVVSRLCSGLPDIFSLLLRYSNSLKFVEEPNYNYWINAFTQLIVKARAQERQTHDKYIVSSSTASPTSLASTVVRATAAPASTSVYANSANISTRTETMHSTNYTISPFQPIARFTIRR